MKKLMMAFAASMCVCASALALEDNDANRAAQADRYLVAMPVREMMSNMAEQTARNVPAEQRQTVKDLFTKHVDMAAIEKAMKKSLVKDLTADELKAMADFYGSAVGKSAIKKFGGCMGSMMPVIREEVMKAQAKAMPTADAKLEPKAEPKSDAKPAK